MSARREVVKPDLKGKKVEVSTANGLSDKYVGTYKANIVIEKDGEFVNIGERTLEIDSVQDGIIQRPLLRNRETGICVRVSRSRTILRLNFRK